LTSNANPSEASTLPSRSKNPPQKSQNLSKSLPAPPAQKRERPVANSKSYPIAG